MFNPDDFIEEGAFKDAKVSQITLIENQLGEWHDKRDKLRKGMKDEIYQGKYYKNKLKIFDRIIEKLAIQHARYKTTGKADVKELIFLGRKYVDYAKSKNYENIEENESQN